MLNLLNLTRTMDPLPGDAPLTQTRRPRLQFGLQFRLLVSHLLDRFFNNEVVSVDGETLPLIMTAAWAIALPTLVATIFLFPGYHGFAPHPARPSLWGQVADRYFFVMYEWVAMAGITVFEWDLLFPNLLDVFVLSLLPIAQTRLLFARVTAVVVFLGGFLLGTSSLGILFFPLATEPPHALIAMGAHAAAVLIAGLCAVAQVLALQGVLIAALGARIFRMLSTLLQCVLITFLSVTLFLFPLVCHSLEALIPSGSLAVRCFPPFWFLGIYESLIAGPANLPAFTRLAHIGYETTACMLALAVVTYPLAYRRSVRQAVEGSLAPKSRGWLARPVVSVLHTTLLRTPAQRAVYHFINQTLLRSQRHRLFLAMYAGLGIALALAWMVELHGQGGHVHIAVSVAGVRMAIPALAFWIVAGLCAALLSPADAKGSWLFTVIQGKVSAIDLRTTRLWVLVWSIAVMSITVGLASVVCPALRGLKPVCAQALVAFGICLLLTDAFTLQMRTIPFTEARVPRNTDLAFILLRYIVAFPALVLTTAEYEGWIEASFIHLICTGLAIAAVHVCLRLLHRHMLRDWAARLGLEEEGELSQVLRLQT